MSGALCTTGVGAGVVGADVVGAVGVVEGVPVGGAVAAGGGSQTSPVPFTVKVRTGVSALSGVRSPADVTTRAEMACVPLGKNGTTTQLPDGSTGPWPRTSVFSRTSM